uniref:Triosephosphate isomerase, cytosolic n=1 Tax=Cannabis sativa TaxID=3483 RepID=A0A803R1V8_CANSA
MGRKFFVGGNWKCNGTTEEVKKIINTLNEAQVPSQDVVEVVVSPPYVFLPTVKSLLRPDFHVAAQNCWVKKGGAFTGEVSARCLSIWISRGSLLVTLKEDSYWVNPMSLLETRLHMHFHKVEGDCLCW